MPAVPLDTPIAGLTCEAGSVTAIEACRDKGMPPFGGEAVAIVSAATVAASTPTLENERARRNALSEVLLAILYGRETDRGRQSGAPTV